MNTNVIPVNEIGLSFYKIDINMQKRYCIVWKGTVVSVKQIRRLMGRAGEAFGSSDQ